MRKIELLTGKELEHANKMGELTHKISLITKVELKGLEKVKSKYPDKDDQIFLDTLIGLDKKQLQIKSRELESQLTLHP